MNETTLVLSDGTWGNTEALKLIYGASGGVRVQSCTASMMGVRASKVIVDAGVLNLHPEIIGNVMHQIAMRMEPRKVDIAIISH